MSERLTTEAVSGNLGAMLSFVENAANGAGASQSETFALRLVADEICTNVIKYAYATGGPGPITIDFDSSPTEFVLVFTDRGQPFDPDSAPAPDLDASWEERKIGGLGLFLVQEMMDEVTYTTGADGNQLRVVKKRDSRGDAEERG